MKKFEPRLERLVFEIRYSYGHLYFDRCGVTLNDIERECDGWIAGEATPLTGNLDRPDKNFHVSFNNAKFDFTAEKAFKHDDLSDVAKEIAEIWKLIEANLGLEELIRVGLRLQYVLPTMSIDEAEQYLKKSAFNIKTPESLKNSGYNIKKRKMIAFLSKDETEYRIEMGAITQTLSVDPSRIATQDPRILSRKQRDARIAQLKQLSEYSADPMYALIFDIDCFEFEPKSIAIEKYIKQKSEIVEKDFLPILEEL